MGRMNIELPDELEDRLRATVGQAYGARKGAITYALVDAVQDWIVKTVKAIKEPVAGTEQAPT